MGNAENTIRDRQDWIDIAKGIGIIAMLIGHNDNSLLSIIYSFHMPLFFILAGYTIKSIPYKDLTKATIKDVKRLIIPCVITRFIIFVGMVFLNNASVLHEIKVFIACLVWGNHNGSLFGLELPSIGRIWFLVALFWAKLFYRILLNKCNAKDRLPFLVVASLISMYLGVNHVILPQNFDMIFVCVLFMEIGHWFKDISLEERINNQLLLIFFAFWTYFSSHGFWISMNMRVYPGFGCCILVAVVACMCIFLFSKSIEKMRIAKPLMFFGQNSLILLSIQSIAPYFFIGKSVSQKAIDMLIECMLMIFFVYAKNYIQTLNVGFSAKNLR